MTRYRGNGSVAAPDQHGHRYAVTGVTAPHPLTCAATGNGAGPETEEAAAHGAVTSADGKHEYQRCTDENCPRFPCQVYKEGFEDGHRRGFDEGYAKGYEDGYRDGYDAGYKQGFADGIEACPRPHGNG